MVLMRIFVFLFIHSFFLMNFILFKPALLQPPVPQILPFAQVFVYISLIFYPLSYSHLKYLAFLFWSCPHPLSGPAFDSLYHCHSLWAANWYLCVRQVINQCSFCPLPTKRQGSTAGGRDTCSCHARRTTRLHTCTGAQALSELSVCPWRWFIFCPFVSASSGPCSPFWFPLQSTSISEPPRKSSRVFFSFCIVK